VSVSVAIKTDSFKDFVLDLLNGPYRSFWDKVRLDPDSQ